MKMEIETVNKMLSELLEAYGFIQMSRDVMVETDKNRLARYARVVSKAENRENRMAYGAKLQLANGFKILGLC